MQFPMPSWSTILTSSTADVTALFNYFLPFIYFIVPAILVIGAITLVAVILLKLVHPHK